MSTLAQVVAALDPALRRYAVDSPNGDRFEGERAFVLEAVYEGYLLHYEKPRAFEGMDDDTRLLAGDSLYALGLEQLAATGDLEAVAELSDLISLCAFAHAEGRPELVQDLWAASSKKLSGAGGDGARKALDGSL